MTESVGIGDLPRAGELSEVRRTAALAGIDDYLAGLPQGYDTMLSRVFFDGSPRRAATRS